MPLAAVVIGLALVVVILALTPAGRRLVATGLDVIDGSVAMYGIRRTLGLDTTTARQRRIDRRHAREQADILRRIGGPTTTDDPLAPVVPPVAAPTRLVVSGETPSTSTRRRSPRATLLRDGAVVAAGLGIVLLLVAVIGPAPQGAVLGATATPDRLDTSSAAAPSATSRARLAAPTTTATPAAATPRPQPPRRPPAPRPRRRSRSSPPRPSRTRPHVSRAGPAADAPWR